MIISGGARCNGRFFAKHLMRMDDGNERVTLVEFKGLVADNVRDAFDEMQLVADGSRASNYFYHANINIRPDEKLTPEQWTHAANVLESKLGLTDQPRFIVEHFKEGRVHRHIVWSRIDPDTMKAVSDSYNYRSHEEAARELEQEFEHEPVIGVHTRKRGTPRPERTPADWETFRAQGTGISPKELTNEVTSLWQTSDSPTAFIAALEQRGLIFTRGDRRDFCIVDAAGDEHSLGKRIKGIRAAELRARMAEIEVGEYPSVEEGRGLARQRWIAQQEAQADQLDSMAASAEAVPAEIADVPPDHDANQGLHGRIVRELIDVYYPRMIVTPPDDILQQADAEALAKTYEREAPAIAFTSSAEDVHKHAIAHAIAGRHGVEDRMSTSGEGLVDPVRAWLGNIQTRFNDWRATVQDWHSNYSAHERLRDAPSQPAPRPVPTPPSGPEHEL